MLYSTGQIGGFVVEAENIGALSLSAASSSRAPSSAVRTSFVATPPPSLAPRPGVSRSVVASRPRPTLAPAQGVDLRAPDPAPPARQFRPRTSTSASPVRAVATAPASSGARTTAGPSAGGFSSGASSGDYYAPEGGQYAPPDSAGTPPPSPTSSAGGDAPAPKVPPKPEGLTQAAPEAGAAASFFEANKVPILAGGALVVGLGLFLALRK